MSKAIGVALAGCLALLESGLESGPQASPDDEVAAVIKKLKGEVTIDDTRPGRPVVAVNL